MGTCTKAAAGQWKKDKPKKLRVRVDNPCLGIAPPGMDDAKELQWLYPDEFLRLLSCGRVPLDARHIYALAVYLFVRAGELKALDWSDVDIERGIVSIRLSWDRDKGEVKQTKTGNKGIRRFAIEPGLMPLLRVMHAEASGVGCVVVTMRDQKWWAADLRKHLDWARVDRAALFRNDSTCKRLRFHDDVDLVTQRDLKRGEVSASMPVSADEAIRVAAKLAIDAGDLTRARTPDRRAGH